MKWSDLKEVASKAAPVLGTLLAGPAGGAVGALVANALGAENDPKAVAKALMNPEQVALLQKWAYENQQALEQIALDTLRAELADKANARENHKHSPMPAIVTVMMTVIVAALLWALFYMEIPEGNRDVAYMLFGQATALWGASVTYWVGTTRSSAEKDRRTL